MQVRPPGKDRWFDSRERFTFKMIEAGDDGEIGKRPFTSTHLVTHQLVAFHLATTHSALRTPLLINIPFSANPLTLLREYLLTLFTPHQLSERTVSAPSYVLTLKERTEHVYVSVHQKDIRCVGISPYVDVGVTVLSLDPSGTWSLVASTGNSADRQNQTETLCLEAGQYLVLPTSTGCKLRHVRYLPLCCVD